MFKTVSEEVRHQRLAVCKTCNDFRSKSKTCRQCGCFVPAKVIFAGTDCPIGLWTESEPGKDLINILDEMILESWNKK